VVTSWRQPCHGHVTMAQGLPLFGLARVTPAYFAAQRSIAALQGRHRLWLAGMYLHDVDCHEGAVMSAINGARRLAPSSERLDRLTTPGETPRGGPAQVPGTQR
jgi:predicted NAD/FAD-binding protein